MATIKGTYKGNLRNEMTHVQSGNTILTDAPTDNHGKGEAFSPTDLACAALAGCMMTIMGISAQGHKFDIDGTTYTVKKTMNADPRRIGQDGVPRLHVGHLIAEIAFVGSFDCCHNNNVLLGTALRLAQGPAKAKAVEPVETPTFIIKAQE